MRDYTKQEILVILNLESERVYSNYKVTKNSNAKKEFDDMQDLINLVQKSKLNYYQNIREVNRIETPRDFEMVNVGDLLVALFLGTADHSIIYKGYDIKYLSRKNKTTKYKRPTIVFSRGVFYEYNAGGYMMGVLE